MSGVAIAEIVSYVCASSWLAVIVLVCFSGVVGWFRKAIKDRKRRRQLALEYERQWKERQAQIEREKLAAEVKRVEVLRRAEAAASAEAERIRAQQQSQLEQERAEAEYIKWYEELQKAKEAQAFSQKLAEHIRRLLEAERQAEEALRKAEKARVLEAKLKEEEKRKTVLWNAYLKDSYWQDNHPAYINQKIDVLAKLLIDFTQALTLQKELRSQYLQGLGVVPQEGVVNNILSAFGEGQADEADLLQKFPMYRGQNAIMVIFDSAVAGTSRPVGEFLGSLCADKVKGAQQAVKYRIDETIHHTNFGGSLHLHREQNMAQLIIEQEELIEQVRFLCNGIDALVAVARFTNAVCRHVNYDRKYMEYVKSFFAHQDFRNTDSPVFRDFLRGVDRAIWILGFTRDEAFIMAENECHFNHARKTFEEHLIKIITTGQA